ncbi:unnamed protein product [Parnassius apollo]|uniref:(apollo) hypothetical protein n=1 Tax=Parnassius apollo TaxID=110799 RepID=A0A8S3WG72_PARAO|nr:unnamed protein product [Parnassius apollo]
MSIEPVPSCSDLAQVQTNINEQLRVPNRQIHQTGPSMTDYVVRKKPLPINRMQQLDEQLVRMIAKGYHTLRLVEEVEFRKFIEMLNHGYTLPTRKTLSESLLPKVYNKVMEAVKMKIAKAVAICITTDAWTSIVNGTGTLLSPRISSTQK